MRLISLGRWCLSEEISLSIINTELTLKLHLVRSACLKQNIQLNIGNLTKRICWIFAITDAQKYCRVQMTSHVANAYKRKGTVHPRTGHEGAEGEKRYSCTFSLTSALDGVGGQRHAPAALPLGKRLGIHCWTGWVGRKFGRDGCGKSRPHGDSIPGPSSQ